MCGRQMVGSLLPLTSTVRELVGGVCSLTWLCCWQTHEPEATL